MHRICSLQLFMCKKKDSVKQAICMSVCGSTYLCAGGSHQREGTDAGTSTAKHVDGESLRYHSVKLLFPSHHAGDSQKNSRGANGIKF